MKRKNMWHLLAVLGFLFLLIACEPKAVPEVPVPAEATPVRKTLEATPTQKPLEPIPTSTQELGVGPKPGARLTGSIEISGKASSGTINLAVSEDGTSITSVSIALKDLKCEGFSAGSMTKQSTDSFAVTKGDLAASLSGIGEIKGRFTSPTEASGTINITFEMSILGKRYACELGTWKWRAAAPNP